MCVCLSPQLAMATASVDQATLRRTRDTLGKIIKKPPLSDKLLNRPPFRYMHDIISEVRALPLGAVGGKSEIFLFYR